MATQKETNTPPLKQITWTDAQGGRLEWTNLPDVEPVCKTIVSVGFVIAETDTVISVAPHYGLETADEHAFVCGVMHIPKTCITHTKNLN